MADFLEAGHLVALLLLLLLAAFVLARLQIVARIYIIAALITVLVATSCAHISWYKFKVLVALHVVCLLHLWFLLALQIVAAYIS